MKDTFGWNNWGLVYLIESLGLSKEFIPEKDLMDIYKKNMSRGLYEKPFDFFNYSMNDVFALFVIAKQKVISSNKILQDIYGVTEQKYLFTIKNIPSTTGSLVRKFFLVYFENNVFQQNFDYLIAFRKHGILNEFSSNYSIAKDI